MIQGIDVALYFIGLDSAHKVFNKEKVFKTEDVFMLGVKD